MRHLTTSLALPAVAAGIALLAGTAIAVGIMTSPATSIPAAAASPPMGTEQMMLGMAMPRAGTPVSGQDVPVATNSIAFSSVTCLNGHVHQLFTKPRATSPSTAPPRPLTPSPTRASAPARSR